MCDDYTVSFLGYCERLAEAAGLTDEFVRVYTAYREEYGVKDSCNLALDDLDIVIPEWVPKSLN